MTDTTLDRPLSPLQRLMASEFARFLLVGGFSAGVNVVARYLLNRAMPFEAAVLVAYLFGMITAYLLSRHFVFQASGRKAHEEFVRFCLVNAVSAAQVWLVSEGLARLAFPSLGLTWHAEDIAHVIGVLSPVVTSYFGHRHFSFRK
ncbi:GtrA family protein [Azospirillum sp. B4]|uniref:GtrA family protein n=1 Tax=Azospirillum sp. B4 TaxID=95605 RepID=UPI000348658F|nr:GtrA family protein [Azospirillum sp. B4]